jgi:hypothetical protein
LGGSIAKIAIGRLFLNAGLVTGASGAAVNGSPLRQTIGPVSFVDHSFGVDQQWE